jgi:hypothetical protein
MADIPIEIKPSFFSIAGFLVPGIVFDAAIGCLLLGNHYNAAKRINEVIAPPILKDVGIAASIVIVTVGLSGTFVIGAALSETFSLLRTWIFRPIMKPCRRKYLAHAFRHKSLRGLIRGDVDALESYVYVQTCGLDLDWYAGRVRMLGGSGVGLTITAFASRSLGYSCVTAWLLVVVSLLLLLVAAMRSYRFDKYVIATAAVLIRTRTNLKPSLGEKTGRV